MFLFYNATIRVYKLQYCVNNFYPAPINATMMTQILKRFIINKYREEIPRLEPEIRIYRAGNNFGITMGKYEMIL